MKWVPLVVKTSDRISSSSLEETPMDRSSFVFEQYREVFQELQGRPLYEEKSPRVEESLAYPSYPRRANISYISLPKLGV